MEIRKSCKRENIFGCRRVAYWTKKNRQTKIKQIGYEKLELQEYLMDGNKNINTSKFIFKAKTLDIKTHKGWKYDDKTCIGCNGKKLDKKF